MDDGHIPVFWACGVTPQNAMRNAHIPVVIAHKPGCMLITDIDEYAKNPIIKNQGENNEKDTHNNGRRAGTIRDLCGRRQPSGFKSCRNLVQLKKFQNARGLFSTSGWQKPLAARLRVI